MAWFLEQYVPETKQREDLRFDINSADLSDLPPLYVSIAECDPLVDDGKSLLRARYGSRQSC